MCIYSIEEIKSKSRPVFAEEDYIEKAYLFGSYARGEAKEESDIDVLLELNRIVGWEVYSIYDKFELIFKKRIDVLTTDEIESNERLKKLVNRDKVLIYER